MSNFEGFAQTLILHRIVIIKRLKQGEKRKMTFYFAWSQPGEDFSPDHHCIEDEKVFSFDIREAEGDVPKAFFSVHKNQKSGESELKDPLKTHCFFSCKDEEAEKGAEVTLLFQGVFEGESQSQLSLQKGQNTASSALSILTFTGLTVAKAKQIEDLKHSLAEKNDVDPLVLNPKHQEGPSVAALLGHQFETVFIPRAHGDVRLVSAAPKSQKESYDITPFFHGESLMKEIAESASRPFALVGVAKWTQAFEGTTDVSSALKESLQGHQIESLTPQSFERKWWRADQTFGQNGYKVASSELRATGYGREIPFKALSETAKEKLGGGVGSRGIMNGSKGKTPAGKIRAVRYDPKLSLSWRFQQPRQEAVYFADPQCLDLLRSGDSLTDGSFVESGMTVVQVPLYGLSKSKQPRPFEKDIFYKGGKVISNGSHEYRVLRSYRSGPSFEKDLAAGFLEDLGPSTTQVMPQSQGVFFETERGQQLLRYLAKMYQAYKSNHQRALTYSLYGSFKDLKHLTVADSICFQNPEGLQEMTTAKITKVTLEGLGDSGRFRVYIQAKANVTSALPRGHVGFEEIALVPLQKSGETRFDTPHLFGARDLLKEVSVFGDASTQMTSLQDHSKPFEGIPGTRVQLHLEDLRSKTRSLKTFYADPFQPQTPKGEIK